LTIVQAALRAIALVVIPALLAGLCLRYVVPAPGSADGWLEPVATVGSQYPIPSAFGLFLLFGWLVRYWRKALPGGGYLDALPLRIAACVPRRDRDTYVRASETYRALAGAKHAHRMKKALSPESYAAFETELAELVQALDEVRVDRVSRAMLAVQSLAASPLAARRRREAILFGGGLCLAALAALTVRLWVVETYQVLSGSMLPALKAGDRFVANKLAYRNFASAARDALLPLPQRGDLIVFQNGVTNGPEHVIKRVVALPGDTVTMHGDHPVINGWLVPSCDAGLYVYPVADGAIRGRLRVEFLGNHAYATVQGPGTPMPEPYVVQPNELFVLGDNRTSSSDSRTWNSGRGGGVPFRDVEGRAERFLLATRRDGKVEFAGFLGAIDRRLSAEGIDARSLEQGIQHCLGEWPKDTLPPESAAPREGGAP
jgi:signal peptidase I